MRQHNHTEKKWTAVKRVFLVLPLTTSAPWTTPPSPRIVLSAKASIKITYSQGPSEEKLCVCMCVCEREHTYNYFLKFCKKISKLLLTNALELICSPYGSESEVTQSCLALYDPMDCSLTRLFRPWDFPGTSNGAGCRFLLQGIFPTQGSNPGLLHCRRILSPAEPQGTPMLPL